MGLFAKAATLRDHEAPPPPKAEPVGESPPPAEVGSQSATARPPGRGGGLLRRSQSVARTHSAPAEPEVGPREPDHPAEPEATPAPPEEAPESPAAPSVAAIQVTETVQAAEAEAAAEPLPETPGAEPLPPEAPDLYEAEPVWEAISPEAGYGDAMVGAELEPAGAAEPLPEEAAPTEPVLEVPLAEESPVEESLAEEPFPPPALEAEGAAQATEELMSDEAVPESFAVEPEAEEPAPSFPEPEEAVAPIVEWDRPEEAAPVPEPETAATESAPTPAATQSIEDRLAATATEILNARAGLDAPGVVFTLLQRRLRLARAALLVPDAPRGVLSPWAASGFDKTTLRRLRFTDQDVASLGLKTLEGPELAALARLFSSRDAATIERLYVWPSGG